MSNSAVMRDIKCTIDILILEHGGYAVSGSSDEVMRVFRRATHWIQKHFIPDFTTVCLTHAHVHLHCTRLLCLTSLPSKVNVIVDYWTAGTVVTYRQPKHDERVDGAIST